MWEERRGKGCLHRLFEEFASTPKRQKFSTSANTWLVRLWMDKVVGGAFKIIVIVVSGGGKQYRETDRSLRSIHPFSCFYTC